MPDHARTIQRQQALADFGELALRSQDLDKILTEACRLVGELLQTNRAKILEIQHAEQQLLVRAGVGWASGIVGTLCLPMEDHSSETFAIKAGEPVITQDIKREDRFDVPSFMKQVGVVALVNVPIFLPGGRPYGLLEVDDTERRDFDDDDVQFLRTYTSILGPAIDRLLIARALRSTEERFRLTVEAALDHAILLMDTHGRITEWLPGARSVFGWTVEEAVGQLGALIFTPEDRERRQDQRELEIARKEGVAPDIRWHIRKDSTRVFIEGSTRALREPDGTLLGFLKVGQDVTERRGAEEQLRESEQRQRALLEALPQLLWRSAEGGEWTWAGPQWTAYTGLSAGASRGRGWIDALHAEDRQAADDAWTLADRTGLFQVDCRIYNAASHRYIWFQTLAVPVRDADGRILEWVGASTDIEKQVQAREVLARGRDELSALVAVRTTELMAAEANLRQAQKMEAVGQLTGGIAHDFNNMLQGVGGSVAMARRQIGQGDPDRAMLYLDAARGVVERAAGLTRRLLAFARRQRLETKPVDADRLIAGLADLIRRTVGPGITVDLRLRDGAGMVLCDVNELESALLNLCINARDAMQEGGRLALGTSDVPLAAVDLRRIDDLGSGDYVAVSVTDTGTGIPPELLDRVLEPFFTTKPQGQGTGLGLSQVYGFVRQSGGLMRIESTLGLGTTIHLLLPLHRRGAVTEEPAPLLAPEVAGSARTVLLVDDEDAARRPVADRLRELGYVVLEARDGPEALRVLASSARPDLLITDAGLPNGMNGR